MKSVGIVTIQGRFNYGNRLQNYAVDRIYRSFGYFPESLTVKRAPSLEQRMKMIAKKILGKSSPEREATMTAERLAAFDRFNKLMAFRELDDLKPLTVDRYEFFSAGSDQVWGMGKRSYGEDWRFLQFAKPDQRIALAPSFGVDTLTDAKIKRLGRYMRGYRYISVREDSGARFIRQASGREATIICDPTLILSTSEWRSASSSLFTPQEEYVFAYLLGDISDEARNALDAASEHGDIPIVFLSDRERDGEPPAGPSEFISLVDNARWVVTDSFHGSVFSSIFQTPLTIVHRGGSHEMYSRMFGRLETLSKKLGIEHKVYGSPDFDLSRAGDYEGVSEAIERERGVFLEYLGACLDA